VREEHQPDGPTMNSSDCSHLTPAMIGTSRRPCDDKHAKSRRCVDLERCLRSTRWLLPGSWYRNFHESPLLCLRKLCLTPKFLVHF
jgi:hypothetical protein